jgi:outer membrane protein OmpA-like peptidoglycan-associated protein
MAVNNRKSHDVGDSKFFLFEWVIKLKEKYGILNILTSGLLMVFMSVMLMITFNPTIVFDKYREYDEYKHAQSFNYRMKSSKTVSLMLKDMLGELGGIRAFVIEMHNGKSNSTGLSFNYGSQTYEELADNIESVREDYSDFSLDRYPIIMKIYDEGYWAGTVEDMKKIDKRLALKLESNDAYYIAVTTIYGMKSEIGFLGITFSKDSFKNTPDMQNKLRKYATQLSPFLDGERVK